MSEEKFENEVPVMDSDAPEEIEDAVVVDYLTMADKLARALKDLIEYPHSATKRQKANNALAEFGYPTAIAPEGDDTARNA